MKLGLKARRLLNTESGHHRLVDGYHRLPRASGSSQNLKNGSVNNRLNRDETLIEVQEVK